MLTLSLSGATPLCVIRLIDIEGTDEFRTKQRCRVPKIIAIGSGILDSQT